MAIPQQILDMCRRSADAARRVADLDAETRAGILRAMAGGIVDAAPAIATANAADLEDGERAGLSAAMLDRLRLTPDRIEAMAEGIRQVAALDDPIGRELSVVTRPNGLRIAKVSVPLGVVAMIYESRPNVTADAAAVCLKAGNAAILRGGSEALRSNQAILEAMVAAGAERGLPEDAVQLVPIADRAAVRELLKMDQFVDLVIPRGGEGLIRTVAELSRVPVLKHYTGVCHVYVDRRADLEMARRIAVNAKCQRPGVCNAMETLLVHRDVAESFLPTVAAELSERGVELRGDERVRALVPGAGSATEDDWSREYLDLILSVRVVDGLDDAIDHITRYGSRHSDVIVTADEAAADRFTRLVDSATVYVNASSRFTDGFEFGMGAEIGISTDKLHARGPCGVAELTTYKYVVRGDGQIRE
ncbi:MAG: glutamate-5-semialdehyde dehydrogenase [Planctomycetota bacterium]|jgi:glutamate-5-semialdehyde dehydrogenase